jgi:hypothetical protein
VVPGCDLHGPAEVAAVEPGELRLCHVPPRSFPLTGSSPTL